MVSLPAPPRHANLAWLVVAIVCLAAGVGLLVLRRNAPDVIPPNPAPLQADADRLGAAIPSTTHAAELNADGFAQSPQMRAAVQTDAATVQDMVHDDFVLNQAKVSHSELYQHKDKAIVPLLVRPDGPPWRCPSSTSPACAACQGASS